MTLDELAQKILAAHNANGGSTFIVTRPNTLAGDTGEYPLLGINLAGTNNYAVSIWKTREMVLDTPLTVDDIKRFIRANFFTLASSNTALGTWTDKETGKTYLDTVCLEPARAIALHLAKTNGQLAIYHLKTGETIYL